MNKNKLVICPYCNTAAVKKTGAEVFPHLPKLGKKIFYTCSPCNARVGCHKNTDKPMGTLANRDLRVWRKEAHDAFDPLWETTGRNRTVVYNWLANQLRIPKSQCHIGLFDIETCKKVIQLCPGRGAIG